MFSLYHVTEELIKNIPFIINGSSQVCHRKPLAGKAANHHVTCRNRFWADVSDVIQHNVVSDVLSIGGDSICINIICPNNIVASLNHSKVKTTSPTEERYDVHDCMMINFCKDTTKNSFFR